VALARWHARHPFCAVCGTPSRMVEGGHKRRCANPTCAAEHFPRTDPAIIVLVEHEDRCFLARNARHRPGMHTTLAGFVEPGESLEDAVRREVREEASLALTEIAYQSSQSWPFPASLMVGFRARAHGAAFTLDGEELIDARWFTRAELRPYLDGPGDERFNLPGNLSISRRLIEEWVREKSA
jgi:NAD+ diphosphatase